LSQPSGMSEGMCLFYIQMEGAGHHNSQGLGLFKNWVLPGH